MKKEKLQLIRERKMQLTEIKRLEIKRRRIAEVSLLRILALILFSDVYKKLLQWLHE